jgi:hypothetical protein
VLLVGPPAAGKPSFARELVRLGRIPTFRARCCDRRQHGSSARFKQRETAGPA